MAKQILRGQNQKIKSRGDGCCTVYAYKRRVRSARDRRWIATRNKFPCPFRSSPVDQHGGVCGEQTLDNKREYFLQRRPETPDDLVAHLAALVLPSFAQSGTFLVFSVSLRTALEFRDDYCDASHEVAP